MRKVFDHDLEPFVLIFLVRALDDCDHLQKFVFPDPARKPGMIPMIVNTQSLAYVGVGCTSNVEEAPFERQKVDVNHTYSIKYVLPAILNSSTFLKEKYSKPTYNGKNYIDKAWVEFDTDGKVINPYKNLDKIFDDNSENYELITSEKISDGGAAMSAYAKMQFLRMSDYERNSIINGLKRYVELDTLSMCMIYEHFRELLDN